VAHGDKKGVAKAKKSLQVFRYELQVLQERYIGPLEKRFFSGDPGAIDEAIVALSIDVPSYRAGYRKEDYYRRLKKAALSEEQISKLKAIVLQRCASREYRREDLELGRLLVKLADMEFLNAVEAVAARKGSMVEKHKQRMLEAVLHGRKDLAASQNPSKEASHDSKN
jgi:hypothetical protein